MAGHIDGVVNIQLDQLSVGIKTAKNIGKRVRFWFISAAVTNLALLKPNLNKWVIRGGLDGGWMSTLLGQLKPCDQKIC